ncbi:TIGR02099 family protein [Zooshikella marina]|uniref:YhdP family protein n=1 Tax=Zooshikella ganghwensis TaxID=202772 RepID=UPI001BAEC882|nr:YhdP family protein [Zooshikella ganghwensis]MBU2705465.1 TIGR02099 family protein [Zooshikella ganghwensis]
MLWITRWFSRIVWWLAVTLVVLVALYVSLGRFLLPHLSDYREELAQTLTEYFSAEVSIGQLAGSWQGFNPALVATDVVVKSPQAPQQNTLSAKQIILSFDTLGSILAGSLVFEQLEVNGANVQLQEYSAKQWRLRGFQDTRTGESDFSLISKLILQQNRLHLLDSTVLFEPLQGTTQALSDVQLTFENTRQGIHVTGSVRDSHADQPSGQISIAAKISQWGKTWQKTILSAMLDVEGIHLTPWFAMFLPESVQMNVEQLNGKLWITWNGQQLNAHSKLDLTEVKGRWADYQLPVIQHFKINNSQLQWSSSQQWQWRAKDLALAVNNQPLLTLPYISADSQLTEVTRLKPPTTQRDVAQLTATTQSSQPDSVNRSNQTLTKTPQITLALSEIDLAALKNITLSTQWLPKEAHQLLSTLNPVGKLRQVWLDWQPANTSAFVASARLDQVGVDAWENAPSGSGISGYTLITPAQGVILLDTKRFSLGMENLFRRTWYYDQAAGRLEWRIFDNQYELYTHDVALSGDDGHFKGQFRLQFPFDDRPAQMALTVGVTDGDAQYTGQYLPARGGISEELVDWLDQSIKRADIESGAFVYNGSLDPEDLDSASNFGLFFKISQGTLQYDPAWPVANGLKALVHVSSDHLNVEVEEGGIYTNSKIDGLQVTADFTALEDSQPLVLNLTGNAQLVGSDANKLLHESPIAEALAEVDVPWSVAGDYDVNLGLSIPLEEKAQPTGAVDIGVKNGQIKLPKQAIHFDNINGALRYEAGQGMVAKDLRGEFLGSPLAAKLAVKKEKQQTVQTIQLQGPIQSQSLMSWLGAPKPVQQVVQGKTDVTAELKVYASQKQAPQLTIETDLQGVGLNLPIPFAKSSREKRPLQLSIAFQEPLLLRGMLQNQLSAALLLGKQGLVSANLLVGRSGLISPIPRGIQVAGWLPVLDVSQWQKLWAGFDSQGTPSIKPVTIRNFAIDKLIAAEQQLNKINVSLLTMRDHWRVLLDSADLKGQVNMPFSRTQPMDIWVDKAVIRSLADKKVSSSKSNQDTTIQPQSIPAMNLRIHDLTLDKRKIGSLSANIRPNPKGLQVQNIVGDMQGLSITGDLSWNYQRGFHRSFYKGVMRAKDIGKVLENWGYAATLTSKKTKVSIDVNWPGSPLAFALKTLTGKVDSKIEHGRFVETERSANALKLLGILNFNSIARRLRLDFSDLFSSGVSFDKFKVYGRFNGGILTFDKPVTIEGPSADFQMDGVLNFITDKVDAFLVVTLPVTDNLPIIAVLMGAPQVGGAIYLFDKLLGNTVQQFASARYRLTGTLTDPKVSFDKIFSADTQKMNKGKK